MGIKLFTNNISSGKKVTFADIIERHASAKEAMTKVASANAVVKKAESKEKDEADSSGQPEWEGKQENVNDPKVPDEKDAASEETVKKASGSNEDDCAPSSGQLDVEPLHQKGESEAPGDITCENKKTEATGKKSSNVEAKEEAKEDEKEDKTASVGTNGKFVRVSKLNDKTRSWLREYWLNLYPADYVDAMLAD